MSYKKIILKCIDDLIYHYKSQKRSKIPYIEEEYFLLDSDEQKKLLKEFYPNGIKGKLKYYRSKSGRLYEKQVTVGGLQYFSENKINPFPQIIKI